MTKSRAPGLDPWALATWTVIGLAGLGWLWSLPGGITWYDSGELVAAAFHLGISHPPGQPLYGMLGKAASLLPLGTVAFRCNLLSATAGGVALVGLARLARKGGTGPAALLTVSLAALIWPMAEQTLRAEVYAPTLAAIVWAFALAADFEYSSTQRLGGTSLLTGLAAGLHPLLAAFAWLGMTLALVAGRHRQHRLRLLGAAVLGAAVGNLVWLALPAAGNRFALLPWSSLDSLEGVLATMSAQAYRQNIGGGSLAPTMRVLVNGRLVGGLAGPVLAAAGLVGLVGLSLKPKRDTAIWPAWILAALGLASASTMTTFYPANPDLHGYLLPTFAGLALASGIGLFHLFDLARARIPKKAESWTTWAWYGLAGLLVVGSATLHAGSIADQAHRVGRTDEYLAALSDSSRPGPGLLVASSDHALFTLVYAKAVEAWRPDLALASRWLVGAKAPWYRRWLKARWPWVYVPLVDDEGPTQGLRRRFEAINARQMPTYLEEPGEAIWSQVEDCGLFYALVPHGVLRRDCVVKRSGPQVLAPIQAKLIGCYMACRRARFLGSRGRIPQAEALLEPFVIKPPPPLPPLASEFLCTAARPLVLKARLLVAEGKHRQAEKQLLRALALDPRFADTYVELGRLLAAKGALRRAKRMELRALALAPKNVTALFYLALIEHRLGRTNQADRLLRRARALDSGKVDLLLKAHGAR